MVWDRIQSLAELRLVVCDLSGAPTLDVAAVRMLAGLHPSETTWDFDPLEHAQIIRWLRAHPERVHPTYESALAFVRARN